MIRAIKFFCLAFCSLFSIEVIANEETASFSHVDISVGSMSIPFAYEQNGDGVYNQIFNRLVEGYEGRIDITFFPSNRLSRAVEARQIDCLYIATETIANNGDANSPYRELEFIGPVNLVSVVVYLPADAADITEIDQLKGLSIASDVNLVPFVNDLGIQEDFDLQSQIQMIEMLVAGRVDALIGYDFDLDFLTRKQGVRGQLKKASIKLLTIGDGIACFSNEKIKPFRDHMKARLKDMTDSGWLDEALKDYR